ncbi:MAG: superoxide dismutase [Candidatus Auribacter fodinae]|jgi:Fe-Mn family superoxide dismutase|uniref:Superoxide dismutase n=1 Tax=Candidatus Auribacter fodinae TaxID=2093366 RepID=A0A3A4R3K0_9BACT|nr:MAG: superoxide dismutase [Candidatus Auribacter fodinae]
MSHELGKLPYSYDALEPYIDAQTMELHYTKHHQGYVNNLNNALSKNPELSKWKIEDLLSHLDRVPESIRSAVRNNGGGHYNHSIFWSTLAPANSSNNAPSGNLCDAIDSQFGSFSNCKDQLCSAALSRFGSGWAWLALNKVNRLEILSTANQDNPISDGMCPIFGIDVWEHAYYLKYQNRRADYVNAIFNVLNWKEISERYSNACVLASALRH